jgi:hypothetical protein
MATNPEAPDTDEMQQRLDELGDDIDRVREKAEADGLLPEDDPEDREPTLADPDPAHSGDDELPNDATG